MQRRAFLASLAAGATAATPQPDRAPIIDTHLEVWTFDPKFLFTIPSGRT